MQGVFGESAVCGFFLFQYSFEKTHKFWLPGMSFFEILLLAFALAIDAFVVSVGAGSTGATQGSRSMVRLSFHLGLFQFLMPILGWIAGRSITRYVQSFGHWIAFALLLWVAVHMIRHARGNESQATQKDPSRGIMMVALAIATSLDALAVGVSLALLQVSIWYPAVIIGIVTGATSFVGILLGRSFSKRIGEQAAVLGGVILIFIGIRIVLSHLFLF